MGCRSRPGEGGWSWRFSSPRNALFPFRAQLTTGGGGGAVRDFGGAVRDFGGAKLPLAIPPPKFGGGRSVGTLGGAIAHFFPLKRAHDGGRWGSFNKILAFGGGDRLHRPPLVSATAQVLCGYTAPSCSQWHVHHHKSTASTSRGFLCPLVLRYSLNDFSVTSQLILTMNVVICRFLSCRHITLHFKVDIS